jgi:DNA replication and repair protein RecF
LLFEDDHLSDVPTPEPLTAEFVPEGQVAELRVTRLALSHFRSYQDAVVETPGAPVAVTGPNGVGKTNLLEALSFLTPGRGLRRARISAVERLPAPGQSTGPAWAVNAQGYGGDGPFNLGTGRDPEFAGGREEERSDRRVVHIDGRKAKSQNSLGDVMHMAWLTPEMDRLFVDSATDRRRFLDRLVFGFTPAHAGQVSAYERAMRERSRLLRDGRFDDSWLSALEDQMAAAGVALAVARRQFVESLADAAELGISAFPAPDYALEGGIEDLLDRGAAVDAEDDLRDRLRDNRRMDAEAGRALVGPHRTDLAVRHRAKDMPAALCSTGEQKALLVSTILAAARLQKRARGSAPLLLLDEIAAHLDETRRAALFDEICALGSQAWMTGTDARLFDGLRGRAHFLTVVEGQILELENTTP